MFIKTCDTRLFWVEKMAMQKMTLATVAAIGTIGLLASVLAVLMATQTFNNTATVKSVGVGVYSDSSCTQKVTSLNWNTLAPGDTKTQTVYVKNEGTTGILLSMTVGNWTPPGAANYMSVTWNRQNSSLSVGSSVSATITLSVSQNVTGVTDFAFEITIIGTEIA